MRSERPPAGGRSLPVALLFGVAAVCAGLSLMFSPRFPLIRMDSAAVWVFFLKLLLDHALQAVALLAVGLAGGILMPRLGTVLEKLILRSPLRGYLAVLIAWTVLSSGLFNYVVLNHMPHIQDEIAMEFQAKVFAAGKLYAPAPPVPEAFDYEFIVVDGGKWYGKYFPMQSLPLVPGVWLGVTWLVHPLLGGVALLLTFIIGRELFSEKIARVAVLLMALSPFRVSLFAMMLSHASCLVLLAVFAWAIIRLVRDPSRWGWGLLAGLSLGLACLSRPLTALGVGGALGLWALAAMPWRRLRPATVVAGVAPLALLAAGLLGYNATLTGDPLITPFHKWSPADRLGFGPDIGTEYWHPRDRGHSLTLAIHKDGYFNMEALGTNLTGWGHATLLLPLIGLAAARCRGRRWLLLGPFLGLAGLHLLHITHGVVAGQARYWSEAMPMLMLMLAVALASIRFWITASMRFLGVVPAASSARAGCWLAVVLLTASSIPRAYLPLYHDCRYHFWGIGPELRDLYRAQPLENALVFVKCGGHYRWQARYGKGIFDQYGAAFILNDPFLSGPAIFARYRGPQRDRELLPHFPGRRCWVVDPTSPETIAFIPYDPATAVEPPLPLDPDTPP